MSGTLIVLEGTDGSGKSTQFSLLCRTLEQAQRQLSSWQRAQALEPL